jgi:hypothetical protein
LAIGRLFLEKKMTPPKRLNGLLENLEFVIPSGVCEVRNLSFLSILIEEGFLATLGMTGNRVLQRLTEKLCGRQSASNREKRFAQEEICGAAPLLLKFFCRDPHAAGPASPKLAGGRPLDVTT